MHPIAKALIDRLYVEMAVDADAHTKDARAGLPLIRRTAYLVPGADGIPQLVLL
jgi:hypothetical protein